MHIGIDGNEANVKNRVGSNIYAYQILSWFRELERENDFTIYLKTKPLPDFPSQGNNWHYRILSPNILWTRWRLPLELYSSSRKPEIFFTPGHYAPKYCPMPMAVSIMDLSFLHFPEMFRQQDLYKLTNWTKDSIKRANHIFTISEFNKNDIIKNYSVDKNSVTVTYPGFNKKLFEKEVTQEEIEKVKIKYRISGDYILYLGTLQPRKNLVRLIQAFARINNKSLKLVIAGKKGWHYNDIFSVAKKEQIKEKIIFTGFIKEKEKPPLLKGARCLVLVSLYEGFGIPVIEAMAMGTPTVVSNYSCLPEVVGKTGILVNPKDVKSITRGITRAVQLNEAMRLEIIVKSKKRVNKYSWKNAASKTLEVLYELAI